MASYTSTQSEAITDLSIDLHRRRQWAELSIVRLLASPPRWLGSIARDDGLTADDFDDDDTRIIAGALLAEGEWTMIARLRAAKAQLQQAHLWSDEISYGSQGMRWSDQRLAMLGAGMGPHADEALLRTAISGLRMIQSALLTLERQVAGRAAA